MSLAMTITDHWEDTRRRHVIGTLVASGNYVTGGDALPFNNPAIKASVAPIWVVAQVNAGYDVFGVCGVYNSAPPNAKLQFFVSSTGVEVAAGAYPASLAAATITFHAIFPKF